MLHIDYMLFIQVFYLLLYFAKLAKSGNQIVCTPKRFKKRELLKNMHKQLDFRSHLHLHIFRLLLPSLPLISNKNVRRGDTVTKTKRRHPNNPTHHETGEWLHHFLGCSTREFSREIIMGNNTGARLWLCGGKRDVTMTTQ